MYADALPANAEDKLLMLCARVAANPIIAARAALYKNKFLSQGHI